MLATSDVLVATQARVVDVDYAPAIGTYALSLRYSARDPYTVLADFSEPGHENVWRFARDLLYDGLDGYAGWGDVFFWPGDKGLMLGLSSPQGRVVMVLNRVHVEEFLRHTESWVRRGEESSHLDVDGFVAQTLAGGWA